MAKSSSFEQGKLFALGMHVIGAQVDLIEAEVHAELNTNSDDEEYVQRRVAEENETFIRILDYAENYLESSSG